VQKENIPGSKLIFGFGPLLKHLICYLAFTANDLQLGYVAVF